MLLALCMWSLKVPWGWKKAGAFSMRCAGLVELRVERGGFHPGAGNCTPASCFLLLVLCLHGSREGQGNARALLRRELGPNYKQMFFDKYWGKGIWLRDRCFHLWRSFSRRLPVHWSYSFLPVAPRATAYLLLLPSLLLTVASAQCSHQEFECQYLCLEMNGKVFVTQRQSFFK